MFMMQILSIASKDFQLLLKDRGSIFYLFLLPVLFIMLFASLGAASSSRGEDKTILLPVVNLDPGGEMSEEAMQILQEDERLEVHRYDELEARQKLSQAEISWVLFIPENFSADLAAGRKMGSLALAAMEAEKRGEAQPGVVDEGEDDQEDGETESGQADDQATDSTAAPQVTLRLVLHPNHDELDGKALEQIIEGLARDLMMVDYMYDSLDMLRAMRAANPVVDMFLTEALIMDQVEAQVEEADKRPLISLEETTPAGLSGEAEIVIPEFGQIVAVGFAVLFVFLASQTTARSIFNEKRQGSFRRLLAAPLSKETLLAGKLLPNLILTLVQIVVIFLVGLFLLPLLGIEALDLRSDPLGLVLVSIAMALCSTSLGILIVSIARTESQVGGISAGTLWIAGLIGGSIMPSFLLPDFLNIIGRALPHYWANQAYYGLIFRGETLPDVTTDILILLGFTLLFFIIGRWRFNFA